MARLRDSDASKVYYHGTDLANAQKIIKDGIDPDATNLKYGEKKSWLRPQAGSVYLTSSLKYAVIYAIGGDFLGHSVEGARIKDGIVFRIDGSSLSDISPDEDQVGQILHLALSAKPEEIEKYYYPGKSQLFASPEMEALRKTAARVLTKIQLGNMSSKWGKGSEIHYQANVGKKLSKYLPDYLKHFLIDIGSHVAHKGKITPSAAWIIHRNDVPKLKEDASNFFDFAKPFLF